MSLRVELNPFTGQFDLVPCESSTTSEDYHSGYQEIKDATTVIIRENKQSINFTELILNGDLTLDGDLWLA